MGYCSNCFYWEYEVKNESGEILVIFGKRVGKCLCRIHNTGYSDISDYGDNNDYVFVEDDGGCSLYTGEKFGCVHFIKK